MVGENERCNSELKPNEAVATALSLQEKQRQHGTLYNRICRLQSLITMNLNMKRDASHLELQAAQLYEELFNMENALLNRGLITNEELCK